MLRVMTAEAKIGLPEVKLGLIPGWGGTQRTYGLLGASRARRLLFTGEAITGAAAAAIGLVDEAVAADQLIATAEGIAKQILTGGPTAIRAAKRVTIAAEDAELLNPIELVVLVRISQAIEPRSKAAELAVQDDVKLSFMKQQALRHA